MKKVILTFGIVLATLAGYAQAGLGSAVKSATTSAAASSANDIVAALSTKLGGLTATQKTNATSAVGSFLTEKAGIASLAKTDAKAYNTKLAGSKSNLLAKLKTILTVKQYANLLGLKSSAKSNSSDAALSLLSQIL